MRNRIVSDVICADLASICDVLRRAFGDTVPLDIERMKSGVSTWVYRVHRAGEIFYLRVLPEEGDSFAPEVHVHTDLRQQGLRVPEVVYFEHCDESLQRSIMLTRELPGQSVAESGIDRFTEQVLYEAGRELAVVNRTRVDGFGWIKRDSAVVTSLAAEHYSHRDFVFDGLAEDLIVLREGVLSTRDVEAVKTILASFDSHLNLDTGNLAHGDLDTTHIFQHNGRYSGLIDFGEIRGVHSLYDLAHFRLHDSERLSMHVFPWLLRGYEEVSRLPDDSERLIVLFSLLNAIRTLVRNLRLHRPENSALQSFMSQAIKRDLHLLFQRQ